MTSSYWLAESRSPLAAPVDRSAGPVDVAIVGGGVTGCACALRLAEAGKRVRLFEAREIAGGASGRNGGFALRGGVPAYDVARRELGAEQARGLWAMTERYLDRLEQLAGDAFRRTGSLRLATDSAEGTELETEYEALREDGFAVEWRRELPSPSPDASTARSSIRRMDRSSLPAGSGGSRRSPPRREPSYVSTNGSSPSTSSRPTRW